ncbi:lytic transglycosylase domain-containing protein [Paenibacillus sp. 1P07SE]|uniref:lytic transglycosylase domain-containing protein n=1 Tax=Paenibacillus sp. 1P07SE TaxID=3132209 RepID=UPI0039A6CCC9
MAMEIDPRTMKTILQLQWSQPVGLDGQGSDPVDSLFDTMLEQLMNSEAAAGAPSSYRPATLDGYLAAPPDSYTGSLPGLLPVHPGLAEALTISESPSAPHPAGDTPYESLISEAAAKYGVDPSLVKAVIQTESGFRPDAVSSAGAKGLMQLMDGTARGLGVTDSLDPRQNIDGGTRYLAYLLGKYDGHLQVALAAYNAGPGRVDRLGIRTDSDLQAKQQTLPHETQRYVGKVAEALRMFN